MPSSRRIGFNPEAEADPRAIRQHTRGTSGERRRRDCAVLLDAGLVRLAGFPGLGGEREELAAGLRGHRVGQHTIVYRATDHALIVERIIHQARDIDEA